MHYDEKRFIVCNDIISAFLPVRMFAESHILGGRIDDIADTLYMDILASDLAIYPESNHNFVLMYDSHARARYSLRDITDEADHVTYEIAEGEQAHLLYDMSKKKGAVFVRLDGAFYVWELEGIKELGDLYEFADSIHWVKSSH